MTTLRLPITIIIVNWNTLELLRKCLGSIFDSPRVGEVLVVDNGSTDGSPEMIRTEFPSVVLIQNSSNVGFAAANNQAIRRSFERYVLLLNSDTVVHGDVLAASVEYMDRHPNVGVMGCRVLNPDGSMQPTCSSFPTLFNIAILTSGLWKLPGPAFLDRYQMRRWDRRNERDVDVVSGCYMVVRRKAIEHVGLLDENFFFFGEETDWCRRIKTAGWQVRFAPVGEITHFGGGSSEALSYRRDLMLSEALVRLHRKHNGIVPAVAAWGLIFAFNSSRAIYWTLRYIVSHESAARRKRDHFINLVKMHRKVWPALPG